LTNVHKIDIFQLAIAIQQSSIVNEMGGGADISSFSGKKAWNQK
jgi:hypothetical protein